ncbi:nitronate monooxygenase [Virgibacillus sp. NKC19-16]|uniref:NAD(P)H-dependent flavin oxidoreductase n=1 Tax=Virgibacillus salidurans TaxID=2831673 RepID=UPI001F382F69|nr:nitronate monooxygenase family protein [Virgibacillus sp. NKC19-16]UJL46121.1 nitronate monooxygenase [Virgibacillus sp. NKC19-16]
MNSFLRMVNVEVPIIQAGMAGGITTPELVAAVANKGALGTIGAGYMNGTALKTLVQQVKQLTNKPFSVNLFTVSLEASSTNAQDMQELLDNYRGELGIENSSRAVKVYDYLQEKIDIIIEEKIPIVSTAFGVLSSVLVERLKSKQLEQAGYDIVVAQGYEAGGHRGTFDMLEYPDGYDIGLIVLVQSLVENLSVPVIAAGGIHTSNQTAALFKMGVSGVQLGTRFLMAKEAGTNKSYRRALLQANMEDTVVTKVFSGRPARAITNRFVREVGASNVDLLPFPIQNELTKDIRAAGKELGVAGFQSLWAGQGVGAIKKEETVEEIIDDLVGEGIAD